MGRSKANVGTINNNRSYYSSHKHGHLHSHSNSYSNTNLIFNAPKEEGRPTFSWSWIKTLFLVCFLTIFSSLFFTSSWVSNYTDLYLSYFDGIITMERPQYSNSGISTTPMLLIIGGNNAQVYYENGYNQGYYEGKNNVLSNPDDFNLYTEDEYQNFANQRYNEGLLENSTIAENGFVILMGTIFNAPYNIYSQMLNFEFFGVNMFNLVSFLFTLGIGLFVIKLIFTK